MSSPNIPELPKTVTREQTLAALDVLGLTHDVASIALNRHALLVATYARDHAGRHIVKGDSFVMMTLEVGVTD